MGAGTSPGKSTRGSPRPRELEQCKCCRGSTATDLNRLDPLKHSDYPALFQAASELSAQSQKVFFRAFLGNLALLVVATFISIANSPYAQVAILQAMVLFGALACATYLFVGRPDQRWYGGRAVAESIKTLTWRYVSRAEPFDQTNAIDRHQFGLKLRAIIEQNREVSSLLTSHLAAEQIAPELDLLRNASTDSRLDFYRVHRIVEQQTWYAKKASLNSRMVKRFFIALIVTISIAMFFAIAKIKYPTAPFWPTDLFVTGAAGLLSWIQAKRFQELSASYTLTAHEISLIRQAASGPMTDAELSRFVGDAENAFSREHTQWVARKDG